MLHHRSSSAIKIRHWSIQSLHTTDRHCSRGPHRSTGIIKDMGGECWKGNANCSANACTAFFRAQMQYERDVFERNKRETLVSRGLEQTFCGLELFSHAKADGCSSITLKCQAPAAYDAINRLVWEWPEEFVVSWHWSNTPKTTSTVESSSSYNSVALLGWRRATTTV